MSRVRRLTAPFTPPATLPAGERFSFPAPVTVAAGKASAIVDVHELRANPDGFRQLAAVRERGPTVYVTGAFVARVQPAGLTGFEFVPAG